MMANNKPYCEQNSLKGCPKKSRWLRDAPSERRTLIMGAWFETKHVLKFVSLVVVDCLFAILPLVLSLLQK
jgi:hypothetical protein